MKYNIDQISAIPPLLINEFSKSPSNIIIFVGSGISRKIKRLDDEYLPSWTGLINDMTNWIKDIGFTLSDEEILSLKNATSRNSSSMSLVRAGGWLRNKMGESFFNDFMKESFLIPDSISSPVHELIKRLPIKGIVTFNYDKVIETVFRSKIKLVATWNQESKLDQREHLNRKLRF